MPGIEVEEYKTEAAARIASARLSAKLSLPCRMSLVNALMSHRALGKGTSKSAKLLINVWFLKCGMVLSEFTRNSGFTNCFIHSCFCGSVIVPDVEGVLYTSLTELVFVRHEIHQFNTSISMPTRLRVSATSASLCLK